MRAKSTATVLISFLLAAMAAVAAAESVRAANDRDKLPEDRNEVQEATFSLAQQVENPNRYLLAISDDEERSISGAFSIEQLQILRAIMVEADKFALTGEGVGAKEAITTRFMDKQEPAFVVDVQKDANQSLLFLTLKTEIGRITWKAGRIVRNTRREEGFFFALLSRLESTLPKLPSQSPK